MNHLNDDTHRLRRHLAQQSLWAFAKLYLPEHIKHEPSDAHQEIYALLQGILTDRGKRVAIAAPRGFGKSTLVTLVYVLYCIAYQREPFIVLLSATAAQAIQLLDNVRRELEHNRTFREDFLELAGPRPRPWTRAEIETPTRIRVLALGMEQKIRGRKFGKSRPTLLIADDVENRENTLTAESREKLKMWYKQDVLKADAPQANHFFLGTVAHPDCLLAEYLHPEKEPSWIKKHYRAILAEPTRQDLWERWALIYNNREAFEGVKGPAAAWRFYERHRSAMDDGAIVLWPARWTYYDLRIMREDDPISFASELQNEPLDQKDCIFTLDSYHYWDDRFRSKEELLATLGDRLTYYMGIDPSVGEDMVRGDYTAIVILARDQKDGVLYVVEADLFRAPLDQIIETLLAWGRRYAYTRIAVEANQFQIFLAQHLERRSREAGLYLPIVPVKNTTNKVSRISRLQPLLKCGAIQLCRSHRLLLEQLRYFPKGKYDDGPDALEMAVRIVGDDPGDGPMIFSTDRPNLPPGDTGVVLDEPIRPVEPGRRSKEVKETPFF